MVNIRLVADSRLHSCLVTRKLKRATTIVITAVKAFIYYTLLTAFIYYSNGQFPVQFRKVILYNWLLLIYKHKWNKILHLNLI